MLRNCYLKYYSISKKYCRLPLNLLLVTMLFWSPVRAVTQNFRVMLTEKPASSITIGWELIAGCPDTQIVFYDTIDHGQDTSAYRFQKSITASYFHQGMENYFTTLQNLKPDTPYYFVVAEDEGISDRFWFRTLSTYKNQWRAFWTSPDLPQQFNESKKLNNRIATDDPDFVLADGLSSLRTEADWRHWMENWQKSISSSGRITPLLTVGPLSVDVQFLFNRTERPAYTYALSAQNVLITTARNEKLRKRYLKIISSEDFVIRYAADSFPKPSAAIDFTITASSVCNERIPNLFCFPQNKTMLDLRWKNGQLSILSASGEKLLDVFSN